MNEPTASKLGEKVRGLGGNNKSAPTPESGDLHTAVELAKVAAILSLRAQEGDEEFEPRRLVADALDLWREASRLHDAECQLHEILDGVFEFDDDEWERRIAAYVGDKERLQRALNQERYHPDLVLEKLFPAKKESKESRREKFDHLCDFAKKEMGIKLFYPRRRMSTASCRDAVMCHRRHLSLVRAAAAAMKKRK